MNHEILSSYHPASFSNSWLMVWNKSYLNTCHWSPPTRHLQPDFPFRIRMNLAKVWWCEVCPFRACVKRPWALNLWPICGFTYVCPEDLIRLTVIHGYPMSLWFTHIQKRGFAKIGVPQIIQAIRPWLSIETHGDLGYHHFRNPPYTYIHTANGN